MQMVNSERHAEFILMHNAFSVVMALEWMFYQTKKMRFN
jgi:hypothetical protein